MECNDMMNEQDKHLAEGSTVSPAQQGSGSSPLISRRILLRGASAAVPTIMTLKSGAALATSSNMMLGTVDDASRAMDANGNVQCVDWASAVDASDDLGRVDLGSSPQVHVQLVNGNRTYYFSKKKLDESGNWTGDWEMDQGSPVSLNHICSKGYDPAIGPYWYQVGGTGQPQRLQALDGTGTQLRAGFMVSATALSSFASYMTPPTHF